MKKNMTLLELLEFMAECTGDEAVEMVELWQEGSLMVESMTVSDLED
jgi:hypothetical protein